MDWLGNIFIVVGLYLMGNKNKNAFFFSFVGEVLWFFYAIAEKLYSLAFITVVFAVMAARGYYMWNKDSKKEQQKESL